MAVGDPLRADAFGVDLGKFRVATYSAVEGLNLAMTEGRLLTRKLPGATQFPDCTLSRPLDESVMWTDWVTHTAAQQGVDPARANISISALDAQQKPLLRLDLVNAWAKSWDGPGLQAGHTEAAIEKITIVYEDMTIDKPRQSA